MIAVGPIPFKKLYVSGTPTLYLPSPGKNGITLEWVAKRSTVDLLDGSERSRLLGFIPVLTVKYPVWALDDGYTVGTSSGQMPNLGDLLGILSHPTGSISIAPNKSVYWTVDAITVKPLGVVGRSSIPTGVEITFRGRDIQAAMAV